MEQPGRNDISDDIFVRIEQTIVNYVADKLLINWPAASAPQQKVSKLCLH